MRKIWKMCEWYLWVMHYTSTHFIVFDFSLYGNISPSLKRMCCICILYEYFANILLPNWLQNTLNNRNTYNDSKKLATMAN